MIDEYDDGHDEDGISDSWMQCEDELEEGEIQSENMAAPVDALAKVVEESNSYVCVGDHNDSTNGTTRIEGASIGIGKTGETFTVGENLLLMHNGPEHGTSERSLGPIG
ncbi:hypothetical protein L1887_25462 [Cichorium endivia]|nr:hypothetical protein L1887_25462 [Cichorium endivia]